MNEIDDYAPALLRIKAAVKELEADLPERSIDRADYQAALLEKAARDLRIVTLEALVQREQKQAA